MLYTATSASSFIGSIGTNTHLSWANTPYANVSQVASELSYLGISNIRDDVANTTQEFNALSTLMGQGVKVDMLANSSLSGFMTLANNLAAAHPGGILAVEGLNEVDSWSLSYAGLTGYAAAIKFQQDLYTAVKADTALAGVPVYNTTTAGVANTQKLGNLSAYADYANTHIYYGGGQPAYGWSPYDSTYYWTSWMASAQKDAPGRPVVVTETGATSSGLNANSYVGVDEPTQAKQVLNSLMDAVKYGVAKTFVYELLDSHNNGATDAESNYGLFNWDGSAKLSAVAIHDLTQILGAGGALSGAPGSLDYTVSGVPQWGGQLLFEQGDGTYDIVVWAEPDIWNEATNSPIAAPNTPVSVTLASAANVSIYDPLTGASAVQSPGVTSQVNVNVTDHPIIIQVSPTSGGSTGGSTGSTYTGTAATVSANLDSLNGNASVSSIVVSDNAALTLSVAQLQNDGHALAEVQNANGSAYQVAVSDTGADISSALSALAANSHLSSINVTDGAMVTVANSQYAADTAVLNKISGAHTVEITGYTGTSYTAQDLTYDANGVLAERTYHNTNGSLSITGLEAGLTFQSSSQKQSITISNSGDTFIFAAGFAAETINGYRAGTEVLDISRALASSVSQVLADAHSDFHGGTLINFGSGQTIDLVGVSLYQLRQHTGDLHFF